MVDDVRRLNFNIVYLPAAYVSHKAATTRIKLEYFIDRYQRFAIENVFTYYRTYKKTLAAKLLIKKGILKILEIYYYQMRNILQLSLQKKMLPFNKINPVYFIKIEKTFGWTLLKQSLHVILSKKLYEHITRKNYLK